jgi:hypothetical protein
MTISPITGTDVSSGIGSGGQVIEVLPVIAVPGAASGAALVSAVSASATFTPAASAHGAADVVGGAQSFALAANSGGRLMITSATLEIAGGTAEATAWRLYLYSVTPPSALADDAVFDLPSGDRASFLGFIDLGTAVDLGSTQWVEALQINKQIKLAGTGVFGYLVNLSAVTPAAVAHIVTLHAVAL